MTSGRSDRARLEAQGVGFLQARDASVDVGDLG
jgi:hypothetical protein